MRQEEPATGAMGLDTGTLMMVDSLALCLSGLWLAWAWLQKREVAALAWWAGANLTAGAAVGAMRIALTGESLLLSVAAFLLIQFPAAMVWAGTRRFRGARVNPLLVFAGAAAWGVAAALHPFLGEHIGAAIGLLTSVLYMLAAIRELWLGRSEPLPARLPLMVLFAIDVFVYGGGVHDALSGTLPVAGQPPLDSWFGLIYFEGILFAMGTAVFMSALAGERAERRYLTAASVDPLTGAANRRAFFGQAERLLARAVVDGAPLSLIVFDLDRFKTINDTHGHQMGDQVLRLFAATARDVLRPSDLFGRQGGEEFAVVLPAEGIDTAYAIAERVRRSFADRAGAIDGVSVLATVSAGVATALSAETLAETMAAADRALYRAKAQGRNCVRRADGPPDDGGSKVIRVA